MEKVAGRTVAPLHIVSMNATTPAGLLALEPGLTLEPLPPDEVLWLVRAEGTFATNRGRSDGEASVWDHGYLVVADRDGTIRAVGFPDAASSPSP